jgi:hypothetical protein
MQKSRSSLRARFWGEAILAATTAALALLTAIWHDWLEVFGFDPDHHSGAAEWLIVGLSFLCLMAFTVGARVE